MDRPVKDSAEPLAAAVPWPMHPVLPEGSLPQVVKGLRAEIPSWSKLMASTLGADGPARRPSAVLMLFTPPAEPGGPAELIFTRRSTLLRAHRGQISFAGGRCDPQDASPAATALRELHEELGVRPELVQVVGMLPPARALDSQQVFPVVALAPVQLADLVIAPAEVAAVFTLPWPQFGQGMGRGFSFNLFGHWRFAHSYSGPSGHIWGLTARILHSASLE